MIRCNVGATDRMIRALFALIVGLSGLVLQTPWMRWSLVATSVILFGTAIVAWCPLYGLSSLRARKPPQVPDTGL